MTSTHTQSDALSSVETCAAELVSFHPNVRVMVGAVHAALDREPFASTNLAIWVWTTDNRFTPQLFHESSLEGSIETAQRFLHKTYARPTASKRVADEAEGGIIIPDYMY